ncbi:hypothetical protein RC74_09710 [Falsihalocynthiibacter arcticus]|uniref:Uncharacterized protein n=1 Tax=Falsihalocynthiibacter arcticus TaxID=1579316 RepID=A0A126V023_9RHOB|nr:hypothetical protein RC74_09710 [Falsihalocynthiibacter arcticus]
MRCGFLPDLPHKFSLENGGNPVGKCHENLHFFYIIQMPILRISQLSLLGINCGGNGENGWPNKQTVHKIYVSTARSTFWGKIGFLYPSASINVLGFSFEMTRTTRIKTL